MFLYILFHICAVQTFTPMVKYESAYGKTEVVEAQPFLICQPLDDDVTMTSQPESDVSHRHMTSSQSRRKSIQLQVPKIFNKFRRESKSPSYCGSVDSSSDGVSGENAPLNSERNKHTRASICFVPVGKSIHDPENNGMDWTPLHGFVYSSFVLPRRPSYKQACKSSESMGATSNMTTSEQSIDAPVMVFPSRSSFVRSISQPCDPISVTISGSGPVSGSGSTSGPISGSTSGENETENRKFKVPSDIVGFKGKECALDDKLSPGYVQPRKNSKVSFYEPDSYND